MEINKSKAEVMSKVMDILVEHCGIERQELRPDVRWSDELGLDSVDQLTLAGQVENHYQIILEGLSLEQSSNEQVKTLEDLVDLVLLGLQRKEGESVNTSANFS